MSDTFKTKIPGRKRVKRNYKILGYGIEPGNCREDKGGFSFLGYDYGKKSSLAERKRIKRRPKKRARQAGKKEIEDG